MAPNVGHFWGLATSYRYAIHHLLSRTGNHHIVVVQTITYVGHVIIHLPECNCRCAGAVPVEPEYGPERCPARLRVYRSRGLRYQWLREPHA